MDHEFKVDVNKNYALNIKLGEVDKQHLVAEFGKMFHQNTKMMIWFDDVNVPVEQKIEYIGSLYNMIRNLNTVYELMLLSGIKESDIAETLNIPF